MTADAPRSPSRALGRSELALRLLSAGVLAATALVLTHWGLWPFLAMIAVGGVVAAWEWGRLVRGGRQGAVLGVHAATIVAAAVLGAVGRPGAGLLAAALGAVAVAAIVRREAAAGWSALGVAYTGMPVVALAMLRSDADHGALAVFYLFLVAWSADAAAYATGRLFGGPKLSPAVSPNKTWSGFAGGLLVPALLATALAIWLGGTSPFMIGMLSLALALLVQLGDLAESAAKRAFGRKDTSQLIPGHGGLLDRVDGFIFASVGAGVVAWLRDAAHPAAGLLIWP